MKEPIKCNQCTIEINDENKICCIFCTKIVKDNNENTFCEDCMLENDFENFYSVFPEIFENKEESIKIKFIICNACIENIKKLDDKRLKDLIDSLLLDNSEDRDHDLYFQYCDYYTNGIIYVHA